MKKWKYLNFLFLVITVILLNAAETSANSNVMFSIDFDTFPDGAAVRSGTIITNQYSIIGARFSSTRGGPVAVVGANEASSKPNFLIGNPRSFDPIILDIVDPATGVTAVSSRIDVTLISVGNAVATATAYAADLATILDSVSVTNPGTGAGLNNKDRISLTGPGIARVIFEITYNGYDGFGIDDLVASVNSPKCVQPPTGMISWWPGDGNANDIISTNHGTVSNGATFVDGKVGQAFSLNTPGSYVRVADHSSLDTPDGFTVDAWIYPTSVGGAEVIASKWDDPTGQWSWIFKRHNDGSGRLRIEISRGDHNALGDLGGATALPLNTWSHVAATYDRFTSQLLLYVNGNIDARGSARYPGTAVNSSETDMLIGAVNGQLGYPSEYFHGLIDELELYNRTLSTDEIRSIYFAGNAGKCKNQPPVANAGPDQTVECASPQGSAAILNGSASSDPDGDALTYTWKENGVIIATGVTPTVTLSYGSHAITLTVDDGKGGTSSDDVMIAVQDTTPPRSMINGMTGTGGNNDWYRSAVTMSLLAMDACTGVQEIRYSVDGGPETAVYGDSASFTITSDGNHSILYFANDRAGNIETLSNTQPVKIDQTAPLITAATAPAPNAYGWNNTNVNVTFTCSDAVSGIASCTSPVTMTAEGSDQIVTGTAVDAAGNDATTAVMLNIDKTVPIITATVFPPANQYGWHNTDVTVTFTCRDALSGIASCPAPVTVTTEGAGQVITGTAVDKAGNEASTSVTLKIDKTAPAVNISINPGMLWPPNHKMVKVTPAVTVTDANPGTTVVLVSVTSSEPDNGLGDGDTANDIVINGDGAISLRAERSGKGPGRVYTITYQATDIAGNTTTASTNVIVPHNMGAN